MLDDNIENNTDNENEYNELNQEDDTKKQKPLNISGGKLYDEGYYGCVFIPQLKCSGDKQTLPKNTQIKDGVPLDKLIITSQAEDEFAISQSIQEIPLWKNYFIVSETMCKPAPIQEQTEKDLAKCQPLQGKSLSNFRILRMTFGGTPLLLYRTNAASFPLLPIFKHLLEGVSLLSLFGIVHRDLHQGNILIDKGNVARIIDFNLSINARQTITSQDLRHGYTISAFQEPPDSTLVNAISLGYNGTNVINSLIKGKTILRNIQSILGISLDEMRNDLDELYSKSISIQTGNDIKWFKTYWHTIDSWAVGCNFVLIIMKLSLWPQFQEQWRTISPKIIPILKGLCQVNPVKRWDAIQALASFDPQNYIIRKYAQGWLSKVGRV